ASAAVADERREVLQQADAPALALLRVELGRVERAAPDRGREGDPVVAGGHLERRIGGLRVVGVHEVEVRPARDAIEERPVAPVRDLVPAHVRHLEPWREAAHRARDDVEALAPADLLALGEEKLVAEADAEERARLSETGADRRDQAQGLE